MPITPQFSSGIRWRLAGLGVSVLLMAIRPYLPQRHLDLLQSTAGQRPLLMNEEAGQRSGDTLMTWVDRKRHHWRCETDAARALPVCGFFIDLNHRAEGRGVDLSGYQELVLAARYRGTGEHLRISIASFVPGQSDVKDHGTWRPQSGYVHVSQLDKPVVMRPAGWAVPDWWLMSKAALKVADGIDYSNAVTLTVDVPYRGQKNWYDIEITQLELRGELISAAQLYLLLLCAWFVVVASVIASRLAEARRRRGEHMQLISKLVNQEQHLRAEQVELRRKATFDPLTEALNRHGLETALQDLGDGPLDYALFLVDVDHFKAINDRWGHDVGDLVLRKVAFLLKEHLRTDDLVCRWGGEEFIVCARCPLADSVRLADKILRGIATGSFTVPDVPRRLNVTVSIGVSPLSGRSDFNTAVRRADAAMYRAKQRGRNRLEVEPVE